MVPTIDRLGNLQLAFFVGNKKLNASNKQLADIKHEKELEYLAIYGRTFMGES